jgi:hypothetical protein
MPISSVGLKATRGPGRNPREENDDGYAREIAFRTVLEMVVEDVLTTAAPEATERDLFNRAIHQIRYTGFGDDSCCPCNDDDAELIKCSCEVCAAGGSCIQPPYGSTIGELVGKIVENGTGGVVSPANRWIATNAMLRTLSDFNLASDGALKVSRADREIADLEAIGASRHQIYRLRQKLAAGADLGLEVAALKIRLERGLDEDIRAMAAGIEKRGQITLPGRAAVAKVAREAVASPEPVVLGPGVYEMPWLKAA